MFETLKELPGDKILALMELFRDDPRPTKIDLGVGVYKDATGKTPVMRAIKAAEKQLWETQDSKSYVGLLGDKAFNDAMVDLVLDGAVARDRVASAATPGGTGAVRLAFELVRMANPDVTVHVSNPTWPNHVTMLKYLGIPNQTYRYFDEETCVVDFDAMLADLRKVKRNDVVLLHGCCHNPTGANLSLAQWREVVAVLQETGAVPMIDIAYQGFGDGLDEDAAGTRLVASSCPETLIAASCSKNFGVYRERTGLLMMVSADAARSPINAGTLAYLNRQNYSFPPDHGARVVTMVLTDHDLRADWKAELEEVRQGMLKLREQLASELQKLSGSDRFAFVGAHRGMFSRLGLTEDMVMALRKEHGIYMTADSRINIAGLNTDTVPALARAVIDAGG